jgi:hypothetical protein
MFEMNRAYGDCCSRQPDSQRRDSPFILKRRTRWVRNVSITRKAAHASTVVGVQ